MSETWSDEVYRIFGFAPRTFVPSRERFLERVHPEDAARVRRRLQEVIDRETGFDLEFRTLRPNREERFLPLSPDYSRAYSNVERGVKMSLGLRGVF